MIRAWDDARTAQLYDEFTQRFSMYSETSRDVVRLADVGNARRVLDLCCGTGETTRALIDAVGDDAEVIALDGSPAMLDVARRTIDDRRVRWVLADAAELGSHADGVDAIVCNSAIWQTDMPAVFAAAAAALVPGGRFAFNIGRQFMIMPFTPDELEPRGPSLFDYIQAFAVVDHDFVQQTGRRRGRLLSQEVVTALVEQAGLRLASYEVASYETPIERSYAWIRIPVFANNVLSGMPYEQQLEVIDKAWTRVSEKTATETSRWACFVAERPS